MKFKVMLEEWENTIFAEIDTLFYDLNRAQDPKNLLESKMNNLKINISNTFTDIKNTTIPAITNETLTHIPENRYLYNEQGTVTAYTDGSSYNITTSKKYSGYGVLWNIGHPMNLSRPTPVDKDKHTNNAAEICGLIMVIIQAKTIGLKKLCVYTDSRYVMETTNKSLNRWAQYNFLDNDGLPRPNLTLWKKLHNILQNFELELRWVKAHNKNKYNEEVDKLAKKGAEMCRVAIATTARQRI